MKPIYKSLALAAMTLQVSLALNAETRDDESASTMALQAELLDSLRVELVAQNVSGARNLIESGECVVNGSNLVITLDTSEWTRGAMYRVQVLATFGTQTQVIYALNVIVPYYVALSEGSQEFSDNVTIVSTITDVTEADIEGLALEATSQEIKAAITPISQAAEAYNTGKVQLAAAITSKGVETSPTESYPEMAEKVNAISQETYEINGGEMYAAQQFGSIDDPNYWNLYQILLQLLSDGRLVNYGGILLAEYYKGYDSLALDGAGAGGAYVVSDLDENGRFKMYTEDTTHVWATEFDGKGNRWVAYCFADEGHDFGITNTDTSPRTIFIGRKVGNITQLAYSRHSQIVTPDGNSLQNIISNDRSAMWDKRIVLRNIKKLGTKAIYRPANVESIYVQAEEIENTVNNTNCIDLANALNVASVIIDSPKITNRFIGFDANDTKSKTLVVKANEIAQTIYSTDSVPIYRVKKGSIIFLGLEKTTNLTWGIFYECTPDYMYFSYDTNDKTKSIILGGYQSNCADIELQNGWCKTIDMRKFTGLTKANVQAHIFDKLGVNDLSTGAVSITLASAVLNLFTQEEIDAVVARTNITIVGA